jgi:hypothetical protein
MLPGALSKMIFVLTPVVSAILYTKIPDLPSSWLPTSEVEKFLIRILLSHLILLFGSMSLVGLLMHHNRKIDQALINVIHYSSELDKYSSELDKLVVQSLNSHDETLNAFHLTASALQNQLSILQSSAKSSKKPKNK